MLRAVIESAVTDYLAGLGIPAVTGLAVTTKAGPIVICEARSAEEDPLGSGNWRVQLAVSIRLVSEPDETADLAAMSGLSLAVRNALHVDDLADLISSDTLTVWGASASPRLEWSTEEDAWAETHALEVCCATGPVDAPA